MSSTFVLGSNSRDHLFKPPKLAGGANETTKISKPVFQKDFNDLCADKTARSSDQNQIVL